MASLSVYLLKECFNVLFQDYLYTLRYFFITRIRSSCCTKRFSVRYYFAKTLKRATR